MTLDPATANTVAVAAAAVALVALILGIAAFVRTALMRRQYSVLQGSGEKRDFVSAVAAKTREVEALRTEVRGVSSVLAQTRAELSDALRHVSVVRYDAFSDMGGQLSFSVAILDDDGDGLVLTSIHNRADTRSYVKGIRGGKSEGQLSPEERRAIETAQSGSSAS